MAVISKGKFVLNAGLLVLIVLPPPDFMKIYFNPPVSGTGKLYIQKFTP
jgi:hypothetical protein